MVALHKLIKNQAIHQYNNTTMFKVLDIAVKKIIDQGDGCYNDGGVCYYDTVTKHKDIIAHLSNVQIPSLKKVFHSISAEDAKYILDNILKRHRFNLERSEERFRCIKFLQSLQDAHDDAFDPYNRVINRMDTFLAKIESIRSNLK